MLGYVVINLRDRFAHAGPVISEHEEDGILTDKKVALGLAGLVAIMLVIAAFQAGSGPSEAERKAQARADAAEKSVASLTAKVNDLEEQLAAAASSEDLAGLSAQVAETAAAIGQTQSDLAALAGQVADVEAAQSSLGDDVAALNTGVSPAPAQAPATANTSDDEEAPEGAQSVGQTALFADGAVRVFVSKVDTEAGTARLSIGGKMRQVGVGDGPVVPAGDSHCKIVLDGVAGGEAQLSAICGDDLPAPEGIKPGETALLEDGALRVFASRVMDDAARLSVNGQLETLAPGAFVRADIDGARCRVTLDTLDRGHAKVSHSCGPEVVASDPVGTGSTAILADGAAKVFVASVDERSGSLRMAINGFDVITAMVGDLVPVTDACGVSVESIEDGQASFGYDCAE